MRVPMPALYLARHAETVFNRAGRMQGHMAHTPLTRIGYAQADTMGRELRRAIPDATHLDLWASTSGRTLQTMAVICEFLDRGFFDVTATDDLREIDVGGWEGRSYTDIVAAQGPIIDPERRLFSARPPGGEWYDDIARRLARWLPGLHPQRPALVISHGISARVLRGMLVGGRPYGPEGTPIADDLPQGTVVRIENGTEVPVVVGSGTSGVRTAA